MRVRAKRPPTSRELAIVETIAGFRVMSGGQLQRAFFPSGSLIGSRRRTQACLKRLVDESYLFRLQRRVGGERAGSASYCYCLDSGGRRMLDPDVRVRRPGEPGLSFVQHQLAIGDVWVGLLERERSGELEIIEYLTEPDCWRTTPKPFGASEWLKPDLLLSLGVGDYEQHWFIEVDLATESLRRIERACDRYAAHYRSGVEQAAHEVFPRVAWLTTTPRRAEGITSVIARRPEDEQQLFTVGLLSDSNTILKGGEHEH